MATSTPEVEGGEAAGFRPAVGGLVGPLSTRAELSTVDLDLFRTAFRFPIEHSFSVVDVADRSAVSFGRMATLQIPATTKYVSYRSACAAA